VKIFLDKLLEKIKIRILRPITFYENRAVYETMWRNILEPGRPHDNMMGVHCMLDT